MFARLSAALDAASLVERALGSWFLLCVDSSCPCGFIARSQKCGGGCGVRVSCGRTSGRCWRCRLPARVVWSDSWCPSASALRLSGVRGSVAFGALSTAEDTWPFSRGVYRSVLVVMRRPSAAARLPARPRRSFADTRAPPRRPLPSSSAPSPSRCPSTLSSQRTARCTSARPSRSGSSSSARAR